MLLGPVWRVISPVRTVLRLGGGRPAGRAYPVSLVAFAGFIVYQIHRFTFTHSPFLIVLTVFDLIVIVLVWHEWRRRRANGELVSRRSP